MSSEIDNQAQPEVVPELPPPPPLQRNVHKVVQARGILLRYIEGQTPEQIAIAMELTPKQVKAVLRSRPVRGELARLTQVTNDKWLEERVQSLGNEALDTLRSVMRGEIILGADMRFKAAAKILDMNPLMRQKPKEEADGALRELGKGVGEAIIQRLTKIEADRQARAIDGEVIDDAGTSMGDLLGDDSNRDTATEPGGDS